MVARSKFRRHRDTPYPYPLCSPQSIIFEYAASLSMLAARAFTMPAAPSLHSAAASRCAATTGTQPDWQFFCAAYLLRAGFLLGLLFYVLDVGGGLAASAIEQT